MHSRIIAISANKNFIKDGYILPSEDEIFELNEKVFDRVLKEDNNEESLTKLASMFVECVKDYEYYNPDDIQIKSEKNKISISNRDIALVRILFGKAYDINKKAVEIMDGHDSLASWEMNDNLRAIKDIIDGDEYDIYIYDLDNFELCIFEKYLLNILEHTNKDYNFYIIDSYDYHL